MESRKYLRHLASGLLVTLPIWSQAAPFNSFDPRSMGMGGVGVAVNGGSVGPLFNPALLSTGVGERGWMITLPALGGRVYDPDSFSDALDDFQNADYIDLLDASINSVQAIDPYASAASAQAYVDALPQIITNVGNLNTGLQTLDNKLVAAEIGAAAVFAKPGESLGVGFILNSWFAAGGVVSYLDGTTLTTLRSDLTLIQDCISNELNTIGGDPLNCQSLLTGQLTLVDLTTGDINFNASTDVKSVANIRGVGLAEAGITLSHQFELGDTPVAVGITPKYVRTTVFDYVANVDTADENDLDANDYSQDYTDFNLDLGATIELAPGWTAGLVVKNLISQDYETWNIINPSGTKQPTGHFISLKPQARVGISKQAEWYTLAADLDLTENDPVHLEEATQYLGLGGEINALDWLALRLGYRFDLVNSDRDVASLGFGIAIGAFNLDLGVAGNGNEVGAAGQLSLQF